MGLDDVSIIVEFGAGGLNTAGGIDVLDGAVEQGSILNLPLNTLEGLTVIEVSFFGDKRAVLVCHANGVRLVNDPQGKRIASLRVRGCGDAFVIEPSAVDPQIAQSGLIAIVIVLHDSNRPQHRLGGIA